MLWKHMSTERIFRNLDEVIKLGEAGIVFNRGHVRMLNEKVPGLLQSKDLFLITEVDEELFGGAEQAQVVRETPLAQKSVAELLQFCRESPTAIIPLTRMMSEELQQYTLEDLPEVVTLLARGQFNEALVYIQEVLASVRLINFQKGFIAQFLQGLSTLIEQQVITNPDQLQEIKIRVTRIQTELDRIDQEAKKEIEALALLKQAQIGLGG